MNTNKILFFSFLKFLDKEIKYVQAIISIRRRKNGGKKGGKGRT